MTTITTDGSNFHEYVTGSGNSAYKAVAWIFIFLLLVAVFLGLMFSVNHKENRDRQADHMRGIFEAQKETCANEKEGLRNFAALQRENDVNTASIISAITTGFNAQAASTKDMLLAQQANTINELRNQVALNGVVASLKADISRCAKAPNVYADSYLCPQNSCGCCG